MSVRVLVSLLQLLWNFLALMPRLRFHFKPIFNSPEPQHDIFVTFAANVGDMFAKRSSFGDKYSDLNKAVSNKGFTPSSPGFNSHRSQNFCRGKVTVVAEVNQWHWLEESGQWLENVDWTRLVLARGKPGLHKRLCRVMKGFLFGPCNFLKTSYYARIIVY